MLWVKAFHIISMVCWFAALFYLPRLFVYHSMSEDLISQERFSLMERKLYNGIATPAMIATIILGAWLASYNWSYFISSSWFQVKILLVITLIFYHCLCARYMNQLKYNKHDRSHIFYRWFNEFPVLILIGVIILVVVKPSS